MLTAIVNLDDLVMGDTTVTVIEIGGLSPGETAAGADDGYDQINVANNLVVDGSLQISLVNGFMPNAGDEFEILNYNSSTGLFDDATGLFGFDEGRMYFEVAAGPTGLSLIAQEFGRGEGDSFLADASSDADSLGELVNSEYFQISNPSLMISGDIQLAGFVNASGTFSFTKAQLEVDVDGTVLNADDVTMNVLQVGASDVSAFIGIDGPYLTATGANPDAKGFVVDDLDLGLTISKPTITEQLLHPEIFGTKYTTLQAAANGVSFVGFGDDFQLVADDLSVGVNVSSGGVLSGVTTIDWASSFPASGGGPAGYQVQTGDDPVFLDFDKKVIQASTNSATMQIGEFVHVSGAFGFEKSHLNLDVDGTVSADDVTMNVLQLGASNVSAFVGLDGPYLTDTGTNPDAKGFVIDDLDLGVVLASPTTLAQVLHPLLAGKKYTTLQATANGIGFVGFGDDFKLDAEDLAVGVNISSGGLPTASAIDWASSFLGGYELQTGDDPVTLDFDKELIRASTSSATLEIGEFVHVSGAFSFEKSRLNVDIDGTVFSADDATMDVLQVGASNVSAFVGLDGPYLTTTGANPDAKGFVIDDLDLGVVLASPTTLEKITHPELIGKKYTALQATAGGISFVGFGDDFKLEADDLAVGVNISSGGVPEVSAIDWASSFPANGGVPAGYELQTGGDPVNLDFDKELIRASTTDATLEIGEFVHVSGGFGFEKSRLNVDVDEVVATLQDVTMDVLQVGASNVSAFVGIDGPYLTATGTNPDAKGLAIDNLDLGLALLAPTPESRLLHPQLIGKSYTAFKATADHASSVGFGDAITMEADNLEVSANFSNGGLLSGATSIDWTSSFPAVGEDLVGLKVETGGDPVYLDAPGPLLAASGDLTLNVLDVVELDGVFEFELSTSQIFAFVDGTAAIGPGSVTQKLDAVGLLVVDDNGLGLNVDLAGQSTLVDVVTLEAELQMLLNTSGQEYVYEVPEQFLDRVDYTIFAIPAGAPRPDGGEAAPGFYAVLDGTGSLGVMNAVDMTGDLYFAVTSSDLQLTTTGTFSDRNGLIPATTAAGDLIISDAGLVGGLSVAGGASLGVIDTAGFGLTGQFQLEVNTTSTTQTITVLDVADDGTVTGAKLGTIDANTVRMAGGVALVAGPFGMAGAAELVFSDSGFQVNLDASLDLLGFGAVDVVGQAAIIKTGAGPVFAANISVEDVGLGIDKVNLSGDGALLINTSVTDAYVGVAANTYLVNVDGTLQILLFEMHSEFTISSVGGVFRTEINNLDFQFFNSPIIVNVNGFVQSDGEFLAAGSASLPSLNLGPVQFNGFLAVDFSDEGFSASMGGEGSLNIGLPWPFNIKAAEVRAALSGDIELAETVASVALTAEFFLSVTIDLGFFDKTFSSSFSITGDQSWSWDYDPLIARQEGDTVYLNIGVDGHRRDDNRGDLYQPLTAENYTITGSGSDIVVHSLGQAMQFSGVNRIVATDAGERSDFIYIAPGVSADAVLNGGAGNDILTYLGSGTAIINGGAGNDVVRGGLGVDTLTGGSGTDFVDGQDGNDLITISSGSDTVLGGRGDDQITVLAGTNQIFGGLDDDTVIVRGGSNTVYGEVGNDLLRIDYSNLSSIIGQSTFIADDDAAGGGGVDDRDSIEVTVNSNGVPLHLNDQSFSFGNHVLNFDDRLEAFHITDSAASTHIASTNPAGAQWGAAVLNVNANEIHLDRDITANGLVFNAANDIVINVDPIVDGTMGAGNVGVLKLASHQGRLDFTDQMFHVVNGHLVLSAAQGFTDTIHSEARALTAVNRGTGSAGNIIVRETDDLNVLDGGLASGGVFSQHGVIAITLAELDALLTHATGIISTSTSGQPIELTADDFDFTSGENTIAGTGELVIRSTHDDIDYRVGSAGENSLGEDQSTISHDATAHIGVMDFAAIGDEFSLVTIGHANVDAAGVGNVMTFGDIEDDPVIKSGFIPRNSKAAIRNQTQFLADTMTISGDVRAPDDRVEFHAHRARIDSKNLHLQLGADDSGVTGQSVLFELDEQLQHGGWIIGQDRIDIDILNSDGTRPYFSFPDELVSVKSDVGSLISTVNPNSVVDVNTNQSIQIAGLVEVHGADARLGLASDTKLTVLEGAVVSGGDDRNLVTLDAGLLLSVNPGGAVVAGARFDDVNGVPVAVQTGVGADAILNSPHELFIGGTVTTSDEMQLNSGTPQFDHTDFFNGLADVDPDHPLIGLSEYGLLLTGTLTTLAADSELKLSSDADVIVRGNVNVLGANSDLLIQSDRFVYIEGFLDVKDDARILGGVETDGTVHNDPPPVSGSSVYVATTSRLVTRDAGSSIDIHGAQDVDLFGAFVAGGTIGQSGVTFTGSSSSIHVTAGEQVFLDTGLLASGAVTVDSGTPGADDSVAVLFPNHVLPGNAGDDLLSLVVTTAGGITTAGETTDGSGGGIEVNAAGNIELLGRLTAGANVTQQFDSAGTFLGDTVVYSDEPAALVINAAGRAFLGGHTFNEAGDVVQTGALLRSAHSLNVNGGSYHTGEGLLVHAASELTTNALDGSITLTSQQEAILLGLFVAGGRIDTVRDAGGGFLGREPVYFGGDSEVTLQAGGTIEIGQDIVAGGLINLIGGTGGLSNGPGLTVQGSGRLYTLEENSRINLNAPGEIVIQPPGHINEIEAQGFTVSSLGRLTADVSLEIAVDRVDFTYSGTATLTAAATADNNGIADLIADLQDALNAGDYTITTSDNPGRIVGDPFTELADESDVETKLRNGKLLLTSPYKISIEDHSVNSLLLGLDVSGGSLTSTRLYAIDAAQPGSTVNIGAPSGPNGKLSIGGKVRAHSNINLYSGTSPDGIDIDLGPTSILETVNGSIAFSAGQFGDIRGTIIAHGTGSDIVLGAEQKLRIRGSLTADNDILLNAGSHLVDGEVSVQIDGASQWNSYGGGGRVVVTGYNDVVFDGVFGTGSHQLALLELNAEHGNLTIPKTSGSIESDGLIALKGAVVDVQGVVRSTHTTADNSDFEITIDASDTAIINGDLQLTGSLHIDADNLVDVFNTSIDITESDQRVVFSGGDVRFGKPSTDANGDPEQFGVLVTAKDRIEFNATGLVEIGSGSIIATSGDNSVIDLGAGSLQIAGSLLAGASVNGSNVAFDGAGADIVVTGRDTVTLGGLGIINGVLQTVGGTLSATGDIAVHVTGGAADVSFTMNSASMLRTQTATDEAAGANHGVAIDADQDIQIYGAIEALQAGADIALMSGELVLVDGLIKSDDQLTVVGGSDETQAGVIVNEFVFDTGGDRLQGGTLTTNPGGTITLGADDKLILGGVVGEVDGVSGVANTDEINVTHAGNVMVLANVNAADRVHFRADNITLGAGAAIQTHEVGGEIDLRANDSFLIGAEAPGSGPALIQGDVLVHLAGGALSLDGQIIHTSDTGRTVINAVNSVTFFGEVRATNSLHVHAGVGANWTDAQLLGTVTVADLHDGDVTIDGGTLTSGGASSIVAGHDVTVTGSTSVGGDPVPVQRPVIVKTAQAIEVVTGSRQVAIGVIEVPEVSFVTTTTTEQVGTESVRVGSSYNTADVTLTQLGYYNPNAAGAEFRKFFVEGIDYHDFQIDWSLVYDDLTGDVKQLAQFTAGTGKEFGNLTDNQQDSVLIHLGYRRFFNVSFENLTSHSTINGIAADVDWSPSWENTFTSQTVDNSYINAAGVFVSGPTLTYQQYQDTTTVRLPVDGWRDKYVQLPAGAESDILRVVSQGTPLAFTEDVGDFYDTARVDYVQDRSNLTTHGFSPTVHDPFATFDTTPTYHTTIVDGDADNSPARWDLRYKDSGLRHYAVIDGRTGAGEVFEGNLPSWLQGSAGGRVAAIDTATGRLTNAPPSYYATTASVLDIAQLNAGTHQVGVNPLGAFHPRRYEYVPWAPGFGYDFWHAVKDARTRGGGTHETFLAQPDNAVQNTGIHLAVPDNARVWIGLLWFPNFGRFWVKDFASVSYNVETFNVVAPILRTPLFSNFAAGQPSEAGFEYYSELFGDDGRWNDIEVRGITLAGTGYVAQHEAYWDSLPILETFHNYVSNWRSTSNDIADSGRLQLKYQLVTNPTDVFDLRPKFETGESIVKVVDSKSVTQWQTENIIESQTFLTTSRELIDGPAALQGAFGEPSIVANSALHISAGNDVTVQAVLESTGVDQALTIIARQDVLIDGVVPDGAPEGTLPAVATLSADGRISIIAGRDTTLGTASRVVVDGDGVVDTLSEVVILAGRDINLGGSVTAGHLIEADAGAAGSGSVLGDINAELTTLGSEIVLNAGALGGDVILNGSAINTTATTGYVTFTAPGGRVVQTDSLVAGRRFKARAAHGVTANTDVDEYDVQNSARGDVTLLNVSDVTILDPFTNSDGKIDVRVFGDLTVGMVIGSDGVTLRTTGQLTQNAGTTIGGGHVTLDIANAGFTLNTAATGLTLTTTVSGDVVVHNMGSEPFDLDVIVADGSLTLDTDGDLRVTRAVSLTDSDDHDVTLVSGGNIDIDFLSAGSFADSVAAARTRRLQYLSGALRAAGFLTNDLPDLTEATYAALDQSAARTALVNWLTTTLFASETGVDIRAAKASAEADRQLNLQQPIRSSGDVSLTAVGAIREIGASDASVDLVADTLTIASGLGVSGIETALNEVTSITNTSGDVTLSDVDSIGDSNPGLSVVFVSNAQGAVSITVPGDLDVQQVSAPGVAGDVTLTSEKVLTVTNTVVAGRNLTLYSVGNLFLNGGVTAPNAVSLASEADVKLSGTTLNLSTSEAIVIESDSSLSIVGSLESAKGVTLISNHGDVEMIGTISGRGGAPLESLTIIARGNLMRSGQFEGRYRFRSLLNDATYYSDTPELGDSSNVVNSNDQTVADYATLDLVPFTTTDAPVVKDPVTGLDFFRDTDTQDRYLRFIGPSEEEFYQRTDPVTGFYPFSALSEVTSQFIPLLYSTTEEPTQGTLFEEDGVTVIDPADVRSLETRLVRVNDATILERLVPLTLKDLNGGRAAGTSVALSQATIGAISDSVTLIAHGQVQTPELTLSGADSSITVIASEDLTTDNWSADHISAQSTGLFDSSGAFIGGGIVTPSSFHNGSGANSATVSFTALNDITLNATVAPSYGLSLHAGGSIVNLPSSIAVGGLGSYIDLSSDTDLSIDGSLSANGPITLASTGRRGAGGNVSVAGDIVSGAGPLSVTTTAPDSRVDGVISGFGGLNLSGDGVLSLMGANTYFGATNVLAGRLVVSGSTGPGSEVRVGASSTLAGTGNVFGPTSVQDGGSVSPGDSPGILNTSSVSFVAGSTFDVEIGGTIAGFEHDQLNVTGSVDLGGATLTLSPVAATFTPQVDDRFVLIRNDGTDAIVNVLTYAGSPVEEGGFITNFLGTGRQVQVSYVGDADGDVSGNDLVLTIVNTPPEAADDSVSTDEETSVGFDVLANDADKEGNIDPAKTANVTFPASGLLTNNGNGAFVFDPHGEFEYLAVNELTSVTFDYAVFDDFDESDVGTVTITVHGVNDSPSITEINNSVVINEGQIALNSGTFADVDFTDRPTITASIGTITQSDSNNGVWSWSFDGIEGPKTQVVTVTADDNHGGVVEIEFELTINNIDPDLTLNVTDILENDTALLTGTITDIGRLDAHDVDIDWDDANDTADAHFELPAIFTANPSDGSLTAVLGEFGFTSFNSTTDDSVLTIDSVDQATGVIAFTVTHQYMDDGIASGQPGANGATSDPSTIVVNVADDDGGTDAASHGVRITNVAPMLVLSDISDISENGTAVLIGKITDIGRLDAHDVDIDWDDANDTANAHFELPAIFTANPSDGSLTAVLGETGFSSFNSTTDDSVLTINAVDRSTGEVAFTVTHLYLDDSPSNTPQDTHTISATVTDDDTGSGGDTETVLVRNVAPALELDPVLMINENGVAVLTGTISDPGTLDTFTLDLNWGDPLTPNNVQTYIFEASSTGVQTFTLTHQYLDDNPTNTPQDSYTISATLKDDDGATDGGSETVIVNNVNPIIVNLQTDSPGCGDALAHDTITLSGSLTDASPLDSHTAVIDWDDGHFSIVAISANGGAANFTASHDYQTGGIFKITVTLTDDDGGVDDSGETTAIVAGVRVNDEGELQIVGTDEKDQVQLSRDNQRLKVQAQLLDGDIDIEHFFNASDVNHIVSLLCGGEDQMQIAEKIMISAFIDAGSGKDQVQTGNGDTTVLGGDGDDQIQTGDGNNFVDGGAGDDQIQMGKGNDIVLGGAGDDKLEGGKGRDILIGGYGADKLVGDGGHDILIGGRVTLSTDLLEDVRDTWTNDSSYSTRVAALTASGGLLEANVTVLDDNAKDKLKGDSGRDLFFAKLGGGKKDKLKDKRGFEDFFDLFSQ